MFEFTKNEIKAIKFLEEHEKLEDLRYLQRLLNGLKTISIDMGQLEDSIKYAEELDYTDIDSVVENVVKKRKLHNLKEKGVQYETAITKFVDEVIVVEKL